MYGLGLQLTHTGVSKGSLFLSDVQDGMDLLHSFKKAGPIYVPFQSTVLVAYTGSTALSFEKGAIRGFIDRGLLTAIFVFGPTFLATLPGGPPSGPAGGDLNGFYPNPTVIDLTITGEVRGSVLYFNGTNWVQLTPGVAGQVLTTGGPGADPSWAAGGGGVTAHSALTAPSLVWTASAHTGTANRFAVFDGGGASAYMTTTAGGDLGGTYPNPTVTDLTMAGELRGDVLYFNGTSWTVLHAGVNGQFLQTQGAGADPQWANSGSGTNHALLTNLGWTVSGHTGTAGSLAAFNGAGASSFVTGTSHGDVLYFNGTVWTPLPPGSVAGNPLTTQTVGSPPTWNNAIAVNTITESTVANGVVVNTVRNYGKSATNPVAPAPTDGDIYYNTALRMEMVYDGLRLKWLSNESSEFHFGRDGTTQTGAYYRAADGRVMSSTLGWYAVRSGTVVSLGYTRSDADAATFDIVANGGSIATVGSSATGGRDITLNADFTFGNVLAVMNQVGGNITSDVIAYIRVKWRV